MAIGRAGRLGIMPDATVPKRPEQAAPTQLSRAQKVEMYASHLMKEATAKDKDGRLGDAIADYLQAADLLLLLAKGQQDYSKWKAYSDNAIACQQRVRVLIAKQKLSEAAAENPTGP